MPHQEQPTYHSIPLGLHEVSTSIVGAAHMSQHRKPLHSFFHDCSGNKNHPPRNSYKCFLAASAAVLKHVPRCQGLAFSNTTHIFLRPCAKKDTQLPLKKTTLESHFHRPKKQKRDRSTKHHLPPTERQPFAVLWGTHEKTHQQWGRNTFFFFCWSGETQGKTHF